MWSFFVEYAYVSDSAITNRDFLVFADIVCSRAGILGCKKKNHNDAVSIKKWVERIQLIGFKVAAFLRWLLLKH